MLRVQSQNASVSKTTIQHCLWCVDYHGPLLGPSPFSRRVSCVYYSIFSQYSIGNHRAYLLCRVTDSNRDRPFQHIPFCECSFEKACHHLSWWSSIIIRAILKLLLWDSSTPYAVGTDPLSRFWGKCLHDWPHYLLCCDDAWNTDRNILRRAETVQKICQIWRI